MFLEDSQSACYTSIASLSFNEVNGSPVCAYSEVSIDLPY